MTNEPDPEDKHDTKPTQAGSQNSAHRIRILRGIKRARTRLLVCLLTLPVYIVAVWILLNNQRYSDSFMFFYMALWAVFAVDMARRRCPNCSEQFFVKFVLLNLITRRCVHCGLNMDNNDIDQDRKHMKF